MDETAPALRYFPELEGSGRIQEFILARPFIFCAASEENRSRTVRQIETVTYFKIRNEKRYLSQRDLDMMGRLHSVESFALIAMFMLPMLFVAGVAEEAISLKSNVSDLNETIGTDSILARHGRETRDTNMKVHDINDCKCNKGSCGCCKCLEWNSVDGKLCINITHFEDDGISLSMTYDNFTIYNNKTVSAPNQPPICFEVDIRKWGMTWAFDVCLHIYDIKYEPDDFHACFDISGKIMKFIEVFEIKLGCFVCPFCKLYPFGYNL